MSQQNFGQPVFGHIPVGANPYMVAGVIIRRLLILEENSMADVTSAPFASAIDYSVINRTLEVVENNRAKLIPAALAETVAAYVRPDVTTGVVAPITNGWKERRLRFMLEVEILNAGGITTIEQITGYTEFSDLSLVGRQVDPNMTFFINGILEVAGGSNMGAAYQNMPVSESMIKSNIGVLSAPADGSAMGFIMQRPLDIYIGGESATIAMSGIGFDTTIQAPLTQAPETAKRIQASPVRYVSDLLDAATSAAMLDDDDPHRNNAHVEYRLRSTSLVRDSFVSKLSQVSQDFVLSQRNTFTLNDLKKLDPLAEQKITVVPSQPAEGSMIAPERLHSPWPALDQVARMYAQSLPGYVVQSGLGRVQFYQDLNGEVLITGFDSPFGNRPMQNQLDVLKSCLKLELWIAATWAGQSPVRVSGECSVYGYTTLMIENEFGQSWNYAFPTFADSTYSPMLNSNPQGFMQLASDAQTLISQVRGNMTVSHYY